MSRTPRTLQRPSTAARRSVRPVVALLTSGLLLVLVALPAGAHPFGPPLTARLAVDGDTLNLWWHGAEDDWVTLARFVGVFDEPLPDPTDASATMPSVSGLQRLQESERMRAYLLRHLGVTQDGATCDGEVTDVSRLLQQGVEVTFRCPDRIETVDVQVTVLTDVHEAYRAVATPVDGATPARALYTRTSQVETWDFTAVASGGAGWSAAGLGVVVAALVGGVLLLLPSRRGRGPDDPDHVVPAVPASADDHHRSRPAPAGAAGATEEHA